MIKQIKKATIFLMVFAITFTSCDDITDINTDPFAANEVDPALLLPAILLEMSQNRTIELNAMNFHAQLWSASVAFGVFVNPERYVIGPNTPNNVWVAHYNGALKELSQIKKLVNANDPGATNIIGQAEAIEAFAYMNLTQIYGSVPMSQAIQVEFPTPKFDTQEEVLNQIVTLAESAVSKLQTSTNIITNSDMVYKGNRENWIRFANSIKLKALMLLANKNATSEVIAKIAQVATQPLIVNASQVAKIDYSENTGNENPIWRTIDRFAGGVNRFWAAGVPLVNLMNATNDPRRATYFDFAPNTTSYVGRDQGVFTLGASQVSLNIIRKAAPDVYVSPAQINFYLAEAALEGWISGDANTYFRQGIQASMDLYDGLPGAISSSDKATFMASSATSISSLSKANALRRVHEEAYISNFTRPIESWTSWRRNKVPALQTPVGAELSTTIRRYTVPLSEGSSNPNAVINSNLGDPMWFEK